MPRAAHKVTNKMSERSSTVDSLFAITAATGIWRCTHIIECVILDWHPIHFVFGRCIKYAVVGLLITSEAGIRSRATIKMCN